MTSRKTLAASLCMAKLRAKEKGALTQELVWCLFDYDPSTGALTHRIGPKAGQSAVVSRANRKSEEVYVTIPGRGCRQLAARRIIWLWVHGMLPNRVNKQNLKSGNELANLRMSFVRGRRSNAEIRADRCERVLAPLPRVTIERVGSLIIHRGVVPYDFGDPPFERSALAQRMRGEC